MTLMRRRLIACFIAMSLWFIAVAANDPVQQLSQTADQMISALQTNKTAIKSNPNMVEDLAKQILLPQVDVQLMAKLAVGPNDWKSANSQQQQAFTDAFTTLMIRTYASAFAAYTNEKIKFYPLRPGEADDGRAQVKSEILQDSGPSIPVNYRVLQEGNTWKVYDINVDGVSLIQSFRSQFANELNQGGMDQLITALNKHNSDLAK